MKKTKRGFGLYEFKDTYEQECSLQKSSSACYDRIWLGVDNTGPNIHGPLGTKNESINARMHLGKREARVLIRRLQKFVDTGDL